MPETEVAAPDVPGMLLLLRTAQGLTQGELAAAAGMSQGLLSKAETGAAELDSGRLEALASALAVPLERLSAEGPPRTVLSACAFHRKRSSLSVADAKRIRALLDLTRMQVEPLVSADARPLRLVRESPTGDGMVSPEDIARDVRARFSVSGGPLPNLVAEVEAIGVLVVGRHLGSAHLDAVGSWPEGRRPMFLVSNEAPADRRRFTLAHELGHAVMHPRPVEEQEQEADRFASELLMPASDIRGDLVKLTLARLADLKAAWRVSMAALLRRARDVGAISHYEYRRLNIELSTAGYRTREPVTISGENPRLVADAVSRRLRAGDSLADLARVTGQLESEFVSVYGGESS